MRFIVIILGLAIASWTNAQMNPQSKAITKSFFPDPEVEMTTPAFLKQKGFTTYDEMLTFISTLQSKHSEVVSIRYIGQSQLGVKIPLVHIERKNNVKRKVKVWLQGAIHGDEPASTEAMLFLMDKLLNDKQYSSLLENLIIEIVPMANIDGSAKHERVSANGLDLNRDQTKLMAPESRYLKQAFSDFGAEVALDIHEYMPYRKDYQQFGDFGVVPHYDVMLMYSGNLNVPTNLRDFTKNVFVDNCLQVLDENKLSHIDYFSTDKVRGEIQIRQGSLSARSSATSFALSNAVSSLIEIRGGNLGRTSLKRRVYTGFVVALSYIKTASSRVDDVKDNIAMAIAQPNKQLVVTSRTPKLVQNIDFIDLESNKVKPFEVNLYNAWNAQPDLIRTRPTAYILLPSQLVLVEKLKVLGLQVDVLKQEKVVDVEVFVISEYEQDETKTEQVYRQNVKTSIKQEQRTIPAGSFVVSMNQPKSNLAIEVFEPEAPNSFVSFAVLKVELNQELPIYRYLLKDNL